MDFPELTEDDSYIFLFLRPILSSAMLAVVFPS